MNKTLEANNPYGYTGREVDADDLYYYRARYYDPTIQRFISEDPIGFRSGDYNFYRYVFNDPVNLVDPWGLRPPANVPPNVNMCNNEHVAQNMSFYRFYKAVRSYGKWDYKRLDKKYEDFGNYHFGYVAAAKGIPELIARMGAGFYQIISGTSSFEYFNSFFDDPKDQYWIREGYKDYQQNYYNCQRKCK